MHGLEAGYPMIDMRRRDFVTLLASAAAWPLAARAQRRSMPVIGFLRNSTAAGSEHLVSAFRRGLNEVGFVEGQNIAIEYRWADNQNDPAAVGLDVAFAAGSFWFVSVSDLRTD